MARYTGAVCRLCRREGTKLFLKGTKCISDRCPIEKRNFPPGQHGKDRKAKIVGYGLQLHEKQKAKRMYFTLEGQFREYYEKANRATGVTGELLIQQLERRLDNVAFRLGFAISRRQARQVVRHGHVTVNGTQGEHSFLPGERRRRNRDSRRGQEADHRGTGHTVRAQNPVPAWLEVNFENMTGRVLTPAQAQGCQPADQRTADRRVVQQVRQLFSC